MQLFQGRRLRRIIQMDCPIYYNYRAANKQRKPLTTMNDLFQLIIEVYDLRRIRLDVVPDSLKMTLREDKPDWKSVCVRVSVCVVFNTTPPPSPCGSSWPQSRGVSPALKLLADP